MPLILSFSSILFLLTPAEKWLIKTYIAFFLLTLQIFFTPVKTGVPGICNDLKKLGSGFAGMRIGTAFDLFAKPSFFLGVFSGVGVLFRESADRESAAQTPPHRDVK